MGVSRIGVSIDEDLLESFDQVREERGYSSRSEALRDAIRDFIVGHQWDVDEETDVVGVVTLIYDHSKPGLEARLTDMQHDFPGRVDGSFHVHLASERCLEVMLLRGKPGHVRDVVNMLSSTKGVKQVELVTTSAEEV